MKERPFVLNSWDFVPTGVHQILSYESDAAHDPQHDAFDPVPKCRGEMHKYTENAVDFFKDFWGEWLWLYEWLVKNG